MTDRIAIFKSRLASMLAELQATGQRDPATVHELGRLGNAMLADAGVPDWTALKASLTPDAFRSLLATIQAQGGRLLADGHATRARVLEIVGQSVVGSTIDDAEIARGVALLDEIIVAAIDLQRRSAV